MKITIDTTAKTISISEEINLSELVETLKNLLPADTWKEYKLITEKEINWYPYVPSYPNYIYTNPTYCGSTGGITTNTVTAGPIIDTTTTFGKPENVTYTSK